MNSEWAVVSKGESAVVMVNEISMFPSLYTIRYCALDLRYHDLAVPLAT